MENKLNRADRHLAAAREAVTKLHLAFEPEDYCGDERMDACSKRALDEMTLASAALLEAMAVAQNSVLLPKPANGFKWALVIEEQV